MNFNFFLEKLALPLIIAVVLFLFSQISTSYVASSDFYEHKIKNVRDITSINGKIDTLISGQESMEKKMDKVLNALGGLCK